MNAGFVDHNADKLQAAYGSELARRPPERSGFVYGCSSGYCSA